MSEGADVQGGARPGRERKLAVAVSLMRMALVLLDRAGEPIAAMRLQHAIDAAQRRAFGQPPPEKFKGLLERDHH